MVRVMGEASKRPIIFPLSNPTSKAEIDPADAYRWTNGNAIVASGSPFPASTLDGRTLKPSQGNNMYIFPGIGLGAVMAQPTRITDTVLTTASNALVDTVTESMLGESLLYPPLTEIREVSANVAAAVVRQSQIEGLATVAQPTNMPELIRAAKAAMWKPEYKPAEFYFAQIAAKGGLTHTASSSTPAAPTPAVVKKRVTAVKKQKKFATGKKKASKNKK
jgi:malate dehydrogenase (oxaloacetate-decarboxylating)